MKRTPHTHYRKGAHVFVILRDGTRYEDVFEDHKSGCVILRTHGRVALHTISSIGFRNIGKVSRKK
jgi:hypothetical protein